MVYDVTEQEEALNSFDAARRRDALEELVDAVRAGDVVFPEPRPIVNVHQHTFFSFNGYGYSPSFLAWRSRREGLLVAGIVDFDVLDGVDEFLDAGRLLGLRTTAGLETRVYVPGLAHQVMNSPGEPGIAYYMGVGFVSKQSADREMLSHLKSTAQARNVAMLERVNRYLTPVEIDYERDVLPLTPSGNPTERHLCKAYDLKARLVFPQKEALVAFWKEKLGVDEARLERAMLNAPVFQGLIRSKLMKAGGPGYIKPDGPDFPLLDDVASFARRGGAVPTYAWLDGTTDGEENVARLLDTVMAAGTVAVNIIPDRNWNFEDPAVKHTKVEALYTFVRAANERGLPIAVGTEMNAYGQPFVDRFDAPELQPVVEDFVRGALIFYGHTVLQQAAGLGYVSDWADRHFKSAQDKNAFYHEVGKRADPSKAPGHYRLRAEMTPDEVRLALGQGAA